MKSLIRKACNRLLAGVARKEDLDNLYNQISGLYQIQNAMEGRAMLRPMRGWAISPDALAWVLVAIQERQTPTVIEFGSGQSTVALAAALNHVGGRLISVEHDAEYLIGIEKQIEACGLINVVKFVTASLVDSPDGIRSYNVELIPDSEVDVVLIDGPPIAICGDDTRLVPLRWAAKHLSYGGAIFLDDSNRPSEQGCIEQLKAEVRGLRVNRRIAEKGLAELRINGKNT